MATDVSRHPVPAAAAAAAASSERQHHKTRKPFSSLMKRLASLKSHTTPTHTRGAAGRAASCPAPSPYSPDYPYKQAPTPPASAPSIHSAPPSPSPPASPSSRRPPPSATTATTSTFSSPTPSIRSLTTTLTTIQSTAPGSLLDPYPHYNPHPSHHHNPNAPPTLFHHQFPGTHPQPTTDNASIMTLASSSRRRRHSLDTDASVRALAPSSLWGGSRESLPLSVLSGGGGWAGMGGVRRSVVEPQGYVYPKDEDYGEEDASTIERRRSGSVDDGEGREGREGSMRDGSSNVGVWHGVFGHKDEGSLRSVRVEK